MNYQEATAFVHQTQSMGSRMGLERIIELARLMGNPQKQLRFLHVAGTNGKGSVCAMSAEILKSAGYRVGMFTSPELFGFESQFLVNGEEMTREEMIAIAEEMVPAVSAMEDKPSEFEIITVMAFCHFLKKQCDYVVLEVGMGGIDDATNIIPSPELAIIVNIGMDHMQYLGDSLQAIARKKAGIIKKGTTVILADQQQEVMDVIREKCQEMQADCVQTDNLEIKRIPSFEIPTEGEKIISPQMFSYKKHHELILPLLGNHQLKNAAIVLEAMDALNKKGASISSDDIKEGLKNVIWPGRFEIISENPIIIVDGAHNPHGVTALVENLKRYFPGEKLIFITGILADKDYEQMLALTLPLAKEYITLEPSNSRALSAEDCAAAIRTLGGDGIPVTTTTGAKEAVELAKEHAALYSEAAKQLDAAITPGITKTEKFPVICAFGSLYNVNELRKEVLAGKGEKENDFISK